MGHLHRPKISELDVISDQKFDEDVDQNQNHSGTKKATNWFLRSGIFMLSGVVVVAGLTIVTISYLENTTSSSSQASEIETTAKPSTEEQISEINNNPASIDDSTSDQPADVSEWASFNTSSGFSYEYPANWEQLTTDMQINTFSQSQVEQLNQKMTANCSNCPDALEQIAKLEVVSTIGNCQMSDAQLEVIAEKYYLLTNPVLNRSQYSLITNKEGNCGISYVTSSAVNNSPENMYYRAHWLKDDQLITVEIPLQSSGLIDVIDESVKPDFSQEPFASILLTYQQMLNTLQFP